MKQLANFVKIMPLSDYQAFDGTNMTGSSAPDLILSENDLQLQDEPSNTRAGVLYEQSLNVVTARLSDSLRKKYANRRPVMAVIHDDLGAPHLWGDGNQKLYILITPGLHNDSISLFRKATSPAL
ncbi:MAG: hypothetical protein AB2L24_21795 [Mangrovibacterium sp.]